MTVDTLILGQRYDMSDVNARYAGWAKEGYALPGDLDGYNVAHYFDASGRYLGEDERGVEPVFFAEEEETA